MSDLETPHEDDAHAPQPCPAALGRSRMASALARGASPSRPSQPGRRLHRRPDRRSQPRVQVAGGFELKGTIYPYGLDTHYHFEYGTTTAMAPTSRCPTPTPAPAERPSRSLRRSPACSRARPTTSGSSPPTPLAPGMSPRRHRSTTSGTLTASAAEPRTGTRRRNRGRQGRQGPAKEARYRGRTVLDHRQRPHALQPQRREEGQIRLHEEQRLPAPSGTRSWSPRAKPVVGPVKLGTIKRPEGGSQVTYHGHPALHASPMTRSPAKPRAKG